MDAAWVMPTLLSVTVAVCGYLWLDMRQTVKDLTIKIGLLNDAVVRLTVLQEQRDKSP